MKNFVKDPDSTLDFVWDFKDWLSTGDSIVSHQFITSSEDIIVEDSNESGGEITAFISGGVLGKVYEITCRVTTSLGKIDDKSANFIILNQ